MAGNAMNVGIRVLEASRPASDFKQPSLPDINNATVRGIAISVSIAASLIHMLSRRGGILLNNLFALVKIGILLLIIITTIVYSTGKGFKDSPNYPPRAVTLSENLGSHSFSHVRKNAHHFADAFLDVVYTFSGFEQANYVLGEISHPHKKYPIGAGLAVAIVSVLYMAVNVCYVSWHTHFQP
jgi:amino acid transporter